jgi:hypothetical protein
VINVFERRLSNSCKCCLKITGNEERELIKSFSSRRLFLTLKKSTVQWRYGAKNPEWSGLESRGQQLKQK